MIIALDRSIPYWKEFFSGMGEVRPFEGRCVTPGEIRDADALIVRTVTPVDAPLLEGSAVRFVGAASAGMDHVDTGVLERMGIRFGYAAGCNAEAVSDYVLTALQAVAARRDWDLGDRSLAVIGVGHVGSRVARKASALGMEVLLCDPPRGALTGESRYRPLERVLGADILTFHVPLTRTGPCPTWHMVDRELLGRLSPRQVVINSSRGGVVDGRALASALRANALSGAVLDVWEGEPRIDFRLLETAEIGTPHIAGSSREGKIRATGMIAAELGRFFGYRNPGNNGTLFPEPGLVRPGAGTRGREAVAGVLARILDLGREDAELRALAAAPPEEAARGFERLRTERELRPEFSGTIVELGGEHAALAGVFATMGFRCRVRP